VCRRNHHATYGSAVAGMGIGIEDQIGNAGGLTRVESLGDAGFVKAIADLIGADDGDGFAIAVAGWEEADSFGGFVDGCVVDHRIEGKRLQFINDGLYG